MAFSHLSSRTASVLLAVPILASLPGLAAAAPSTSAPAPTTNAAVPPANTSVPPKNTPNIDDTPVASRITADSVRYEGGLIIAEGSAARPAKFISGAGEITAQSVRVDSVNRTINASGSVTLKRTRIDRRRVMRSTRLAPRYERAPVTDILRGESLSYDFKARKGHLDKAMVEIANFNLTVKDLTINGDRYVARNVILRPGGQTPEEDKIYGVPPLNVRAKQITVTAPEGGDPQLTGKGAALYFKNTRILPIPRALFNYARRPDSPRDTQAFKVTPSLSFNSTDRVLVTTRITYPLMTQKVDGLSVVADLGASARQTFRGGLSLELNNNLGQFALRGKVKDIVSQQLQTNRFLLDRIPEISYTSPDVRLLTLPGGRTAGLRFDGSAGTYEERVIKTATGVVGTKIRSSRRTSGVVFTTRMTDKHGTAPGGVYLDLFANTSRYPSFNLRYRATGFEIGYDGQVTDRIRGVFSYRNTRLRGDTPFLFDEVEIPRELRSTFDYQLSPRYLVPIDLRYDLDREKLRDSSFGLLRAYKNFAYGATYNTARRNLSFEFRTGF